MVEVEIDGKKVEVPEGAMVMEAATKLGLYVPHFCYHKKLSIAANCRMCLVEVEKAPKALPACATPVTAGMKVFTHSEKAQQAQKSVMEFLLINHPLDCPICDQGGECQLQDLAVGYGPSASRYSEEKRVVFHKPMGPLISAEEMSRCIHCTRCVRFGQEVAGVMELGMAGRGEHSEILSFVGQAVESELSGNMIDICPVGALTSKPFRYSARTWELSRKRSVSPHDSIGANIVVQSKNNEVKRIVPHENDSVNECWISDRDRFSYEGLNSEKRLTEPMMRSSDGQWYPVSWDEALAKVALGLKQAANHGPNQVRTLLSPNSTLEEMTLAALVTRALKSDSVDFRLRLGEAGFDQRFDGTPTLGLSLDALSLADRVLVVGSFLRQDHPLMAQRLRQSARHGARIALLHSVAQDLLMPTHSQVLCSPDAWAQRLRDIAAAVYVLKSEPIPKELKLTNPDESSKAVAELLTSSESPKSKSVILLGNSVLAHPRASEVWSAAQLLADSVGCRFGFTVEGANGVGGYLAKARPIAGGYDAAAMFASPAEAYLLCGLDPTMDCINPHKAQQALKSAKIVVALTAFRDSVMDLADVVLPIAPYTETSGTYVNCEGRMQTTQAVVRPRGQSRPAWKVLRVLGNLIGAEGFDFDSSEDVRRTVLDGFNPGDLIPGLGARVHGSIHEAVDPKRTEFFRVADIPIYRSDSLSRHAPALQETRASASPKVLINPRDLDRLGLVSGAKMKCVQAGRASAVLELTGDDRVCPGVLQISAAHTATATLGEMIGPVELEAV